MAKNSGSRSRNKGKRGELELAHVLQEHGFDARRGQQFAGINGDADVVGVPGLHIECKRVENLNVEKALVQSEQDARSGEVPVVMHRKNREEWKVTMRLDDFVRIWKGDGDDVGIRRNPTDRPVTHAIRAAGLQERDL